MDIINAWWLADAPAIVEAVTLREVARELQRLRLIEARARGVLNHMTNEDEYTDGARSAARIILDEHS